MSRFFVVKVIEETDLGLASLLIMVAFLIVLISPIVGAFSIIDYGLVFAEGVLTSWIIWTVWGIGLAVALIFKGKKEALKPVIIGIGIVEAIASVIIGCISYSDAGIWVDITEQSLIVMPFCLFVGIIEESLISGVVFALLDFIMADIVWKVISFYRDKSNTNSRNMRKRGLVRINSNESYNQSDAYWKCTNCGRLAWKYESACESCGTAKNGMEQWFKKES